jgi:hypothetical protein
VRLSLPDQSTATMRMRAFSLAVPADDRGAIRLRPRVRRQVRIQAFGRILGDGGQRPFPTRNRALRRPRSASGGAGQSGLRK